MNFATTVIVFSLILYYFLFSTKKNWKNDQIIHLSLLILFTYKVGDRW